MKLLAFDTAGKAATVALLTEKNCFLISDCLESKHAKVLLPLIDKVLAQSGLSLPEVDVIAYGCGPGSFTGLRIAAAVAQGLSFSLDKPVVAVSNLAAAAHYAYRNHQVQKATVCIDARMNEVYWGNYTVEGIGKIKPVGQEHLSAPAEVVLPAADWSKVGAGWLLLNERATDKIDEFLLAEDIAYIAKNNFTAGIYKGSEQVQPVYLRNQVVFQHGKDK